MCYVFCQVATCRKPPTPQEPAADHSAFHSPGDSHPVPSTSAVQSTPRSVHADHSYVITASPRAMKRKMSNIIARAERVKKRLKYLHAKVRRLKRKVKVVAGSCRRPAQEGPDYTSL